MTSDHPAITADHLTNAKMRKSEGPLAVIVAIHSDSIPAASRSRAMR